MIRIICIGKIKEQYLKEMINDYSKRIAKYHKLEIVELNEEFTLEKEGKNILAKLSNKSYNILCDLNANQINSIELSKMIDDSFNNFSEINFIIGSSNGVSQEVKNAVNKSISFGRITIPHGLFRSVLLEQIYRSFKILNNESYHK